MTKTIIHANIINQIKKEENMKFQVALAIFVLAGLFLNPANVFAEDLSFALEELYHDSLKEYHDKNSEWHQHPHIVFSVRTSGIMNNDPVDIIPDKEYAELGEKVTLFWVLFIPKENIKFTLTWEHDGKIYRQTVYDTSPSHRYRMHTWINLNKSGTWKAYGQVGDQQEELFEIEVK